MPKCNGPSKFSYSQVYANSVDPDQTPVLSGFTMFAILSASFLVHYVEKRSRSRMVLQFFLFSNLRKIIGFPS